LAGAYRRRPAGTSTVLRWCFSVLATLITAGCTNLSVTDRSEPTPEPDYRKIVAAGVKEHVKNPASFGLLQISGLKRSAPTQYGDWAVCVKGTENDRPVYFAVFISDHKIVTWGDSVIVDRCATEQYEPMPSADAPAEVKKASAKKARPKPS
jgi:hypothetical protein